MKQRASSFILLCQSKTTSCSGLELFGFAHWQGHQWEEKRLHRPVLSSQDLFSGPEGDEKSRHFRTSPFYCSVMDSLKALWCSSRLLALRSTWLIWETVVLLTTFLFGYESEEVKTLEKLRWLLERPLWDSRYSNFHQIQLLYVPWPVLWGPGCHF